MITKTRVIFAFIVLASIFGVAYNNIQTNGQETGYEVIYTQPLYAVDVTDDNKLVGAADNVFIGTVIKQTDTKTDREQPQTQFSVEVLENIKGNLKGTVIVNQEGGFETIDGKTYLVLIEGDKLLKHNKTYLFATRVSENGWNTIAPVYGDLLITNETDRANKIERFKHAHSHEIGIKEGITENI